MKKNGKGFTLIELLVVIIVISVIAVLVITSVIRLLNNAKKKAAETSAYKVIRSAKMAWESNDGRFGNVSSITFTCGSNGVCESEDNKVLDLAQPKPTGGTITINNGVVTIEDLRFNNYICSKLNASDKVTCDEDAVDGAHINASEVIYKDTTLDVALNELNDLLS